MPLYSPPTLRAHKSEVIIMPADFPQASRTTLTQLNAVTGGAVTFAARVVAVMNSFLGSSNPFGTAATRDTGTGDGDVPVLDASGRIADAALPAASATRGGVVRIAPTLDTAVGEQVATAAQITAESARLERELGGLETTNFQLLDMTAATPFTTSIGGFIIASGGSGDGAGDTTITITGFPQITVRKNLQTSGNVRDAWRFRNGPLNSPIVFQFNMFGKGVLAPEGAQTDAELYIGLIAAGGGTFNVSVGAAGTNGNAGFAYYMALN